MTEPKKPYFPPAESAGGWREATESERIRSLAGMDPEALEAAWQCNLDAKPTPPAAGAAAAEERVVPSAGASAVVVIRHGYIAGEWYENASARTRFNVYSCTKSFTGTAFGMLFEDSRAGLLSRGRSIGLETPAYEFIPEGHPLSDERKRSITVRHLLTMTSAVRGETTGITGTASSAGSGPFEMALGQGTAANGRSAAELTGEPGSRWDYSDPGFLHLSLIFAHAAGLELDEYMEQRVFASIGLRDYRWRRFGGNGTIGPHTVSCSDLEITARDLARLGYLYLSGGRWEGSPIVPRDWVDLSTRSSQALNKDYGLTWWANTAGTLWPGVPTDGFAAMGFLGNKCYVIPSLDLVAVRIAAGPWPWDDVPFISSVVRAVR